MSKQQYTLIKRCLKLKFEFVLMLLKGCLMILNCCVYDFERLLNEFEMDFNETSSCLNNLCEREDLQRRAGR